MKRDYFEVHVFGGACQGEGIIIRLPDGAYGVVDSCVPTGTDESLHPMRDFLRQRNVSSLLFVCMTHPHRDHYLGMVQLLKEFPPREFWHPSSVSALFLKQIIERKKVPALEVNDHEAIRSAHELCDVYREISRRVSSSRAGRDHFTFSALNATTVLPATHVGRRGKSCEIFAIAPHGNDVYAFNEKLASAFNKNNTLKSDLPEEKFNRISAALVIRCEKFTILLGGDVENESWSHILGDLQQLDISCRLFKVSHHGSSGAYTDKLGDHVFSRDQGTEVVMTGYSRSRLPESSVIAALKRRSSSVALVHRSHLRPNAFSSVSDSRKALSKAFGIPTEDERPLNASRAALKNTFKASKLDQSRLGVVSYYFSKDGTLRARECNDLATML